MRNNIISLVATWLVVLGCVGGGRADVAYDNFGPGDSYDLGLGFAVGGPSSVFEVTEGFRFTAAASGRVTRLTAAVRHVQGANGFFFEIHADGPGPFGTVPGLTLGTIGQIVAFEPATPPPPPGQVTAAGSVVLVSGTSYWLVGRATGDSYASWMDNTTQQSGRRAYRRVGEPWAADTVTTTAFRIEVAPVNPGGEAGCRGDIDGNGHVEPADIAMFIATWLESLTLGILSGDFDRSGAVDPADVSGFVAAWLAGLVGGAGC